MEMTMKNIYEVYPKFPVVHTSYTVVASSFDEAAALALAVENANEQDCGGIKKVELVSAYEAEGGSFIGFGVPTA
jgi:hypothetical protein